MTAISVGKVVHRTAVGNGEMGSLIASVSDFAIPMSVLPGGVDRVSAEESF